MKRAWCVAGLAAAVSMGFGLPARAEDPLLERARMAMRTAGAHWASKVASHGGYVSEYSTDLVSLRRIRGKHAPQSVVGITAGTVPVGRVFLEAYEATGEKSYLDAAVAAAHCLVWGQLEIGGWNYRIDFDLKRNKLRYHHLAPKYAHLTNFVSFGNDRTQGATRFLMKVSQYVHDPKIEAAISRALKCLLAGQFKGGKWDGAWSWLYPAKKGTYPSRPTFNDHTISNCVRAMHAAYVRYGNPQYLASVRRCLKFYLRSQGDEPQPAWAQSYGEDLKPHKARRMEPAAYAGGESAGNVVLLLDMYIELGDERCFKAAARAAEWLKRSQIAPDSKGRPLWARFYEIGTNKPLYFTKRYKLTYSDDDLPVHYCFKRDFATAAIRKYEHVKRLGRQGILDRRARGNTPQEWAAEAASLEKKVRKIISRQDNLGRWVRVRPKTVLVKENGVYKYVVDKKKTLPIMRTRTFVRNMRTLAGYVTAAQGGPKAPAETAKPR